MFSVLSFLVFAILSSLLQPTAMASGLGSSCSAPWRGSASSSDPFWLESIKHQGTSAFNPDTTYQVFRNVKDFGAKGDGVTDDTDAINNAIASGGRCGGGSCPSSTLTPAIVYFPNGTYLVSTPIIALYYTQLIGDPKAPPTLLAASNFNGIAVIDADPYIATGQYYANQNNFFRSVRNFVIDLRQTPPSFGATGLHWQVAQATSLINIVVEMSTEPGNAHQGIFMENGSGGFMGDLVFNGGKYGIWIGNQQFTVRNLTVNNAASAIFAVWNWGWTFQGVTINNCSVGFDIATGGLAAGITTVGAEAIIDAVVTDTPIFVRTSTATNGTLDGSIVLSNIKLTNVPTAVGVIGGAVVLNGGTTTIHSWAQGNIYSGTNPSGKYIQGTIPSPNKPSALLDGSGRIFGKTHPQYEDFDVSQIISVKSHGAKGDGVTDDTAALDAIFKKFSGCKIIFFDAGTYIITSTLTIPAGSRVVGEAWSVIAGKGEAFQDQDHPKVVVQVGHPGSEGVIEITDILFSTIGPTAGAIVVEWNIREPIGQKGAAGLWDTHIRLGGSAGTNLELGNCPNGTDPASCMAAFLALHITEQSTAYLEGTWVWLADHDLDVEGDGTSQLTIFSGRGILSESVGPVWMIGTAEHHTLYQYNLFGARNHWMGLIQTETPYNQPVPASPAPFSINHAFHDPAALITSAWALHVTSSQDIIIFGASLYSFFANLSGDCGATNSCQSQIVNVDLASAIQIYSLSTIASTYQLSVNGKGIIDQSENTNGLASTVTLWSSGSRRHVRTSFHH